MPLHHWLYSLSFGLKKYDCTEVCIIPTCLAIALGPTRFFSRELLETSERSMPFRFYIRQATFIKFREHLTRVFGSHRLHSKRRNKKNNNGKLFERGRKTNEAHSQAMPMHKR
jgi:hypothetical protein